MEGPSTQLEGESLGISLQAASLASYRGAAKRDAGTLGVEPSHRRTARDGRARDWGPVATAPYVDIRLGADPIAVLPIASRSPV